MVLPTARHRCDIFSKEAVLPACAMMRNGPRQRVTRFGVILEYNERFDLILIMLFVIIKQNRCSKFRVKKCLPIFVRQMI